MKAQPKIRRDGLCACGCGRPLPRTKEARRYAGYRLDLDPFATAICARAYYGTGPKSPPFERDPDDDLATEPPPSDR